MPFKMHKIIFFPEKKIIMKKQVPTLPKFFRHVTLNTLIFLFGLIDSVKVALKFDEEIKKLNCF